MGCDGGTIPTRDEMIRTRKKKPKVDKEVANSAKWNHCHLSQQALAAPVVADLLGNLYNKDVLIEFLLERVKFEHGPAHVKSLKDVKELKLQSNPSYVLNKQENSDNMNGLNVSPWICPISGVEMNGMFKFCFLFSCGCAFAQKSLKSITQSEQPKCLICDKAYVSSDLVIVNPNGEDLVINEGKLQVRVEHAAKVKAEREEKKRNKAVASSDDVAAAPSTSLKRSSTSALGEVAAKAAAVAKKVKPSIQEDPATTDVFKGLFTTCERAKNQQKAHWVTFNPQYF